MTPTEVRTLSEHEVFRVFDRLTAGLSGPLGIYDGVAWSHDYPRTAAIANRVWQGKVFNLFTVRNRVLGLTTIEGRLTRGPACWFIDYPRLGLSDELRWAGWYWLGRMAYRRGWIWFTLTPANPLTP